MLYNAVLHSFGKKCSVSSAIEDGLLLDSTLNASFYKRLQEISLLMHFFAVTILCGFQSLSCLLYFALAPQYDFKFKICCVEYDETKEVERLHYEVEAPIHVLILK